ncbi:autophagy-related protein 2 homolog B isoform X2 [Frieseomelitta varia]|uniref:autophagy-related protein 2 homolog B isoform X2 n=1 Tax=Frieseomelitta varia TaxID=561572 RepID=UPI001CB6A01A|nr:autophagy-related protein 2 homolog B isoform X2 [Frieseomelitta varia]
MSWLGCIPWSQGIKKRACRYLLQRYLGQFLEEKLTLDQLTVDLYNGTGRVTNVSLDVQALNELGEQQQLPLEFVDGFVVEISFSIPWSALLSEASYVEVKGLKLTVQPRQRTKTGTSMFESMWSSMTSSMQLAQECLQEDAKNAGNSQPLEGVELFAQTIDSILCRVKVRFIDTVIRLEHVPLDSSTGVAIEMCIKNLEYSDEAGLDPSSASLDPSQSTKGYIVSAFTTKRFYLEGVTFHTDEFPSRARTFSRSIITISRGSTPDSKNSDGHFSSAQISPTQYANVQTSPEGNIINSLNESNPIMFAKLAGRQEIRLKLKQGESVSGPKVEFEVTLGSFTSFLSPRQVHVLLELGHGLASPDLEDISNVAPRTCMEKPMVGSDFSRVERELIHQIYPTQGLRSMDLRHAQGWSTASLDESDNKEEFLPMRLPGSTSMSDSITSNNISMDGSILSSSISLKNSATNLPKQQKHRHNVDNSPSAETSHFHVRVSSIAIVLLHEDILATCVEGGGLTCSSIRQMKNSADEFFKQLGMFGAGGYGNKDFDKASKVLLDACHLSHIRLLAAPLVIEGREKNVSWFSVISGTLTLASLEIVECLIDSNNSGANTTPLTEFVELLVFPKESSSNTGFTNKTDFKMKFKYVEDVENAGYAQLVKCTDPYTTVDIELEPCKSEVDITIIDRICALLNPQPICVCNPVSNNKNTNQQTLFYQAIESPILSDFAAIINISSSHCTIKLRFPIPDLRPLHDMNRAPWWKRSVRTDYMILKMADAQIHSRPHSIFSKNRPHSVKKHFEIQFSKLLLSYAETETDVPLNIGRVTTHEKNNASCQQVNEGFDWARIVITIYPERLSDQLEDSSEGELDSSFDETLENTPKHQPSPFSSKRVIHESDTPHSKPPTQGDKDDSEQREGEELIIPGNREEMFEFMDEGTRSSRIQLEINFPCVSVQIPSKHLYELLYNRFNTDLFLWKPSAPRPKYGTHMENHIGLDLASTLLQESVYPRFSTCKSRIQYDSDSDSDEGGIFHSAADKSYKQHQNKISKNGQSNLALILNIDQGLLCMYTPVRDSMRNVIPGQQGELIIRLEDATIFSVTAYKGNSNLGYVCAMIKEMSLDHCGLMTTPFQPPTLRLINSDIPQHCQNIIYKSGLTENVMGANNNDDMVVLAIRIQAAHQTHRIKTFRVAVGITNATLRHRMCNTGTSWFTQLTDCLDVADHPVAGYSPPGILTELHLHLWNCAVDYRPVHLPLRSMITLGNFSVSSNIAAHTNTSTLRFIAEDIALFISNKLGRNVDLRRDYVCVMDVGLFELSLRLNEKMCGGAPRVDLRASNNVLHVRTCSDSGRALIQLLTYFVNDGDLLPNMETVETTTIASTSEEESLLGDECINTLSKSQVERVNSLMKEAMEETVKETSVNTDSDISVTENQVEVFFFPDESQPILQMCGSPEKYNKVEFGIETEDLNDEFCILGEEAGTGIMPRHGVPEVRWLCQESLRIIDNHFAIPLGKTDLLKAPRHFPPPVLRYTLCEMSLIWHMYGGKDFEVSQSSTKKQVIVNDNVIRPNTAPRARTRSPWWDGVGFNKCSPNEIHFGSAPNSPRAKCKETTDWQTMGGPGRRHDILMELQLNKVRFQHEVYPENTAEAARQILLVNEIEIRDRLASSHINKFLYQYSSEARPKQSHANMFAMKAVHVRPDPRLSAQECCLKLSLLPLRLNIDQDSLLFLIEFFNELGSGSKQAQESFSASNSTQSSSVSKQGTPTHHPPVMSVNDSAPNAPTSTNTSPSDSIDPNLLLLLEDELMIKENNVKVKPTHEVHDDCQPIYFRSVIFSPEVFVRLDYHGKRVDLTHGPLAGLLMGLAQLNCSELRLKRLTHRHGLLGFDKLITFLFSEWLQDIKKNQLPSLLGGVGPMHSLVQLFQGIRDLFWLPIEQYQKDGRIIRGLQRGANSFTTSTAMAALELTSRLIHAIQSTAETAYDMVSPGPSVRRKHKGQKGRRKRYNQPLDIREGVANAYMLVKEGLGETANQLVRVASEEHEQKGVSGAVGGVLRQIPPTVVKPIILATEATSNVLGGMQSQLVPDARREAAQKWRQDSNDVN